MRHDNYTDLEDFVGPVDGPVYCIIWSLVLIAGCLCAFGWLVTVVDLWMHGY